MLFGREGKTVVGISVGRHVYHVGKYLGKDSTKAAKGSTHVLGIVERCAYLGNQDAIGF